jgi:hypothetical protein
MQIFSIENFNHSVNSLIVAEIILTQLTNNGCNFCKEEEISTETSEISKTEKYKSKIKQRI